MEEKKNVPKRRFGEFVKERGWKSEYFENLAEIVRGASPRPIQDPKWFDKNSQVGWLRISDVTEQNGRIRYLEQHISELGQKKTRVIHTPHLLLSIAATVGKPVINYTSTGVHDGFLIFYEPKFDIEYMYYWLEKFRPEWSKYGQPGSQVNLNSELVKTQKVYLPSKSEQLKIKKFFQHLDKLIDVHQQKLQKLKAQKQAYLSEMFPQEGETKPKRRFAGFEGSWQIIKFNDLLNATEGIRRGPFGSALKKEFFVNDSQYVVYEQHNAIYNTFQTRYKISKDKYNELIKFRVSEGDFIMSGAGTIGKIARVPKDIQNGVINQALIRIKIDASIIDPNYFIQWMRADEMQNRLTHSNPGSAMVNLVPMTELKNWEVLLPSLEEQQKIGTFFQKLDSLIEKQEERVKKYQALKQAYLNEMFV
ncbi:restriction endonuclease subunit S [Aerococcaceae bacterium DSM 111022]|nr:restriction endonuclease subunit S [Aerococcaceae bacterium DSM 111022]